MGEPLPSRARRLSVARNSELGNQANRKGPARGLFVSSANFRRLPLTPLSLPIGSIVNRAASTTSAAHSTSAPSRCRICSQTGARNTTSRTPSTYCSGEQDQHQRGERAVVPVRAALRRAHQQPDEKDAGQKRDGGMRPAPAHQPLAGGRKSCANAVPSELAGNRVSPSAASDPVTPTTSTITSDAIAHKRRGHAHLAAHDIRCGG